MNILLIFVIIVPVKCIIKNCVSEIEWENYSLNSPKCEIVSKNSPITCYGPFEISLDRMPVSLQTIDNIPIIVCNATYPIDAKQKGFKIKGQPPIYFFRHSVLNSAKNVTERIFSVKIPLFINIWSPRWMIFSKIGDPTIFTKFYLYYPASTDRSLPFDWPNEKIFPTVIEAETRFATLPCQVTKRSDVVELKKNRCSTGEDITLSIDNDDAIRFEPSEGFIIDTEADSSLESIWGVYTCSARNPRKAADDLETLQVTLRKPKDFTTIPDENEIYLFPGQSHKSVFCKSKHLITMSGIMNGRRIPDSEFNYSQNSSMKSVYSAEFKFKNMNIGDSGEIVCQQSSNSRDKRKFIWIFNTLDPNYNNHLEFKNEGSFVKCSSNISSYTSLFNSECFTLAHCNSKTDAFNSFGSGQCNLKLTSIVTCGTNCNQLGKKSNAKCMDIASSVKNGVYKCETDTLSYIVNYLEGYDGFIYTGTNLSTFPVDAIIRIYVPPGKIYTNNSVNFVCQASSFLSNGDFEWKIRKNNITIVPKVQKMKGNHNFMLGNDSIWEAEMMFSRPVNNLEVICLVPIWNTEDQWMSNSIFINVTNPKPPRFEADENSILTFINGDKNRNLPCRAKGDPEPKVKWMKNGKLIDFKFTSDEGENLVFEEIKEELEGTYTCIAQNIAGVTSKEFTIVVDEKQDLSVYIIVAVLLLIILLASLFILYWKLIKAKKEIRNLTDEEVRNFKYGNPEAAKAAKEPHDVIMHLPFNQEFEIMRENLEFDECDILGSGAYGIVYRGKLVGHSSEVAIKTLKPESGLSYFKALLSELKIMVYIGKHRNVVELIGAYTGKIKERVLFMVVELSPFGNLENYLRANAKSFQSQIRNDKIVISKSSIDQLYANFTPVATNLTYTGTLCTSDLVNISQQIASGMQHLESKKVIHADLACRNVLLYNDSIVKITDFGLSRQLYAYTTYMKKEQEPLPWRSMAIESLREMNFSSQSDVWAYGVTLWEIFSLGAVPYPGLSWSVDFVEKLIHGLRLSQPYHSTSEIYDIMVDCWHSDPEQRPKFKSLSDKFENMYKAIQNL